MKLGRTEIKPRSEFDFGKKYKAEIACFTKKPRKLENFKELVKIEKKFNILSSKSGDGFSLKVEKN